MGCCSTIAYANSELESPASTVKLKTSPPKCPRRFCSPTALRLKVADLIAEKRNLDLKLRVFVQGGGCSGFPVRFHLR